MSGLDKLSVKQLKDIIRTYKKEKCPPFSKLKKNDLEDLVNKLGLQITLTPKKPKQPKKLKPVPVPVPVPVIKTIKGSLTPEQIQKYKMTGNNSWTATTTNQLMLYDYILDKHKNDCVPIIKNIDGKESILKIVIKDIQNKNKINVKFAWNSSGVKYQDTSPEEMELVIKKIRQCKKRFVPLPMTFFNKNGGHQNMIIIDLQKNTAEHIEPHGNIFRGGKSWDGLPEFINKKLPELFESWGLKYIPPNETCPYVSGVQSIDPEAKRQGVSKISRIVELDGVNALTGNQGGLCSLWSFILLDLRLSNPSFTIQEIMKEVLEEKSIDEFKSNVLTDFDKETINSLDEVGLGKTKLLDLYNDYNKNKNIKLSDIFFMYAITFAHEAFGKYTPILVKEILKEADNNNMDNFKDYLKSTKVNPFKLMWIFDNTKNVIIKLSYLDENNKIKVLLEF